MKKVIYNNAISMDRIYGMANLNPIKAGIPVILWSDHQGCLRTDVKHHLPRMKISKDDFSVIVTIDSKRIKVS